MEKPEIVGMNAVSCFFDPAIAVTMGICIAEVTAIAAVCNVVAVAGIGVA